MSSTARPDQDVQPRPESPGSPESPAAPAFSALLERRAYGDLATLAYAFGLLVLWSPAFNLGLVTPRIGLAYVALGPGLVVLGGRAIRGDRPSRWAVAFLGWAAVSVATSQLPRLAFGGSYGTDVGWVFLAAYLGAWALGARLSPAGRRCLRWVILIGLAMNVAAAIGEAIIEPTGDLALNEGRVRGLISNTLFLSGLLAGAQAMLGSAVGRTSKRSRQVAGLAALALCTTAANLAGSRAGLVGGVVLAVAAAVVAPRGDRARGRRRARALTGAAVAAAIVVGFMLSMPIRSGGSGSARIADTSSSAGFTSRGIMWGLSVDAVAERPLLGWGPGRYREATAPRTTAAFVRAEGPDKVFYDAHNVVVELTVTTGIVGLVLIGGFAVTATRRSRGPLAWFAAGTAVLWLVNPLSVATVPVAMLALGAAGTVDPQRRCATMPGRRVAQVLGALLVVVGLVAASNLLRADAVLDRAVFDGDPVKTRRATELLPTDPTIAAMHAQALAQAVIFDGGTEEQHRAAVDAARRASDLDPTRLGLWVQLAAIERLFGEGGEEGRMASAERSYERGLEVSPWSVEAMAGLRQIAFDRGDDEAFERWSDRLCEVNVCDLPPPNVPSD